MILQCLKWDSHFWLSTEEITVANAGLLLA
jgi:hypothetical protein